MKEEPGLIGHENGIGTVPSNLRWVWIFVLATFLLSALFDYPIFGKSPLSDSTWGLTAVCWVPGVLGLLALMPNGPREVMRQSLKWPLERYFLGSFIPVGYTTLAYGGAILLGWCGFDWSHPFSWSVIGWPLVGRVLRSTGEELGWRGFLFPALRQRLSFGQASLVSGLIWAAWHYPAIAFGNYNNGGMLWFSLVTFTLMVLGITFVISWLREVSGSVWPCALFHAVNNFYLQQILDPRVIPNRFTPFVTSEWGAALAVGCLLTSALVFRSYRPKASFSKAV